MKAFLLQISAIYDSFLVRPAVSFANLLSVKGSISNYLFDGDWYPSKPKTRFFLCVISLIDTSIDGAAGTDFFPRRKTPYWRIYPLGKAPIYELFMKLCPCTDIEFLLFTNSVCVSPIPKRRAS